MENENRQELKANVDIEPSEQQEDILPKLPYFGKALSSTSSSSRSTFSSEVSEVLKRGSNYYSCSDDNEAYQMSPPVYNQLTEPLPPPPQTPTRNKRMRQLLFDSSPLQRYLTRVDANTEALEKMNLDEHFVFSSPEQKLPSPSSKSIILDHVYANPPSHEAKSQTNNNANAKDNNNSSQGQAAAATSQFKSSNLFATNSNYNTPLIQQEMSYNSYVQTSSSGFTSEILNKILNSGRTSQNNTSPNLPELIKELTLIRQRQQAEQRRHREHQMMIARQQRESQEQEAQRILFKKTKSLLLKCFGLSLMIWITFLSLNMFLTAGYFNITLDKNNTVDLIYFILITILITLESCVWASISAWVFSSRFVPLRHCLIAPLINQILIMFTLFVAFAHSINVQSDMIQQSIWCPIIRFGVCALLQTGTLFFTSYIFFWQPKLESGSNSIEIRQVSQV